MAKAQESLRLYQISYSIEYLSALLKYLSPIYKSMQECSKLSSQSSVLSVDGRTALQRNLDDARNEVNLSITAPNFDADHVLSRNLDSLISLFNNGKLFRLSVTTALNEWITSQEDNVKVTTYYGAEQSELYKADVLGKVNLFHKAMTDDGGNGGGDGIMTSMQFGNAIFALAVAEKSRLDHMAPISRGSLVNGSFANATAAQIAALVDRLGESGSEVAKVGSGNNRVDELASLFSDNVATIILTDIQQFMAMDVICNAIDVITKTSKKIGCEIYHQDTLYFMHENMELTTVIVDLIGDYAHNTVEEYVQLTTNS